VIVYVAAAPLTVKVQPLNVPEPVVWQELDEPIVPAPEIVNVIGTLAANPEPPAVTVSPVGPCPGTSETDTARGWTAVVKPDEPDSTEEAATTTTLEPPAETVKL
jgi:hypothetical protein